MHSVHNYIPTHNDYINGSYPVFEIYDDRVEVISSGGLPVGLSEKEFFAGRSLPRNKELMRVFSDIDMCEQLGSGMKKILKSYSSDIFDISEHFISAKFIYSSETMQLLKEQGGGLNGGLNGGIKDIISNGTVEDKVIECLKNDNSLTVIEIAEVIYVPERTIERAIKSLKASGRLKRVGSKKTGSWQIIE